MLDTQAHDVTAWTAPGRSQPASAATWRSWDAHLWRPGPDHVRRDRPGGRKDVLWRDPAGQPGLGEHRLEDLVYLAGDRVPPLPALVVVTEGEKAADAVEAAGIPAIGTVCGASGTPGPAVIAMLAGVAVVVWPDADQVGFEAACRLALRLEAVVASMALIRIPDARPGMDAADLSPDEIRALFARRRDIWLKRS